MNEGKNGGTKKGNGSAAKVYAIVAAAVLLILGAIYAYEILSKGKKPVLTGPEPIVILFIGNSSLFDSQTTFTDSMSAIAKASKLARPLDITTSIDRSLVSHLGNSTTQRYLEHGHFDFVVLQPTTEEVLQKPDELLDSVKRLTKLARSKSSRVMLIESWSPEGNAMEQEVVSSVTRRLADRLSTEVAPVGDVFQSVARQSRIVSATASNVPNTHAPNVPNGHASSVPTSSNVIGTPETLLAAASILSITTGEKPAFPDNFTCGHSEDGGRLLSGAEAATIVWDAVTQENKTHTIGPRPKGASEGQQNGSNPEH